MFTGIVEEIGVVERLEPLAAGARLRIECRRVSEDAVEGASVAVNGACLTVTAFDARSFSADVSPETLERTTLGALRNGDRVNLERALTASGRLGGHLVQGHVDATGEFLALEALGHGNWLLRVRAPREVERYIVGKGSVAVDGVSLTVSELAGDVFAAAIISFTYRDTTLRFRRPGDRVNLEADLIAKYVEKFLTAREASAPKLTLDKLAELGY
jgi:riboflavin synthase